MNMEESTSNNLALKKLNSFFNNWSQVVVNGLCTIWSSEIAVFVTNLVRLRFKEEVPYGINYVEYKSYRRVKFGL